MAGSLTICEPCGRFDDARDSLHAGRAGLMSPELSRVGPTHVLYTEVEWQSQIPEIPRDSHFPASFRPRPANYQR